MTSRDTYDATRPEAQEAFLGLLVTPLVTAHTSPALLREVLRHRVRLMEWASRLGYRLVIAGHVARLHRDPSGPQGTAAPPPHAPPPRRDLVLQVLAVAACEGLGESATLQELSDEVRALSAAPTTTVQPYDPDRGRAERQAFVRALGHLTEQGVLLRRTADESLLRQWEEDGTGVGAGYSVDHDVLLQFTDPYTVDRALGLRTAGSDVGVSASPSDDSDEDLRLATRSQRLLRVLIEDTALLYADLHPVDADYARARRSWLAGQAVEMTGGTIEMRAEGLVLQLPDDRPAAAAATFAFPTPAAVPWFALVVLDAAIRRAPPPDAGGRLLLTGAEVESVIRGVYEEKAGALTRALEGSPSRLSAAVQPLLLGLGLIRSGPDGGWTVLPTAARFRDAVATWTPTLTESLAPAREATPDTVAP